MNDVETYRRALERIRDYNAREKNGGLDEWTEAAAFHQVQRIARETLDPAAKTGRIRMQDAKRNLALSKIRALKKNERYFYADFPDASAGVWVRFLKGDPNDAYLGIIRVKVLERVGNSKNMTCFHPGAETTMHVDNLKAGPVKP